ncbi:Orotidine 5'-phosphate decarboxylase [Sulfitobacter noctilucae]|uniref:hypothetical protein n=1 Tax=Sulfitobacter noctilucae TaxID=1342302 RepID=UPI00046883EA|nr:hypothetical protein [Sulfitobacter noctilucae]KIN75180.1 Orotidine 5'-phosphate decarboxylase [Sulfitobacter noctilucae]
MYTCPIQLDDVRYNAATQAFEALVVVHDNTIVRRYACEITAPLDFTFEQAAAGLAKQAIRRHQHRGGLFSEPNSHRPSQRAGRRMFDAAQWLEALVTRPDRHAA